MTFADRLAAVGLSRPDYAGADLGAVLPAALDSIGAGSVVPGRDAAADRATLQIPQADHVVVALVDGMGAHQLAERRGHAPFLRRIDGVIARVGYPTTTSASIATFGTGRPPGQTGMLGYTVLDPDTGRLANLVSWDDAPHARSWQPWPSLLALAVEGGVNVATCSKPRFAGSGLTRAALDGGAFIGSDDLGGRVDAALERASRPGLTYLYTGALDQAGHAHGWRSDEWTAALEETDRELGRLARGLPAGAALVITADHGMVDVDGSPHFDIAAEPALADGVDAVAGEPRALHVHAARGADPAVVAARWSDRLGDHAAVGTRAEAIAAGIFGEVDDRMAGRIGDVVVAMAGRAVTVHSDVQSPASLALIGMHGSLTNEELEVPVLVATGA